MCFVVGGILPIESSCKVIYFRKSGLLYFYVISVPEVLVGRPKLMNTEKFISEWKVLNILKVNELIFSIAKLNFSDRKNKS